MALTTILGKYLSQPSKIHGPLPAPWIKSREAICRVALSISSRQVYLDPEACTHNVSEVESFPSIGTTNPPIEDYFLALRHAFTTYGLPQRISLDHGTVFLDNTTPSPFPTRLHLWLIALGIEVQFIRPRRLTDHA